MRNFMKTILSAMKVWTKKEIKNSTADWNENDSNADSYVKNRPFWTDDPKETILIDEQTVTVGDELYAELDGVHAFVAGEKYIVLFNNIKYECIAWEANGLNYEAVIIGNGSIYGGDGGNDEPFSLEYDYEVNYLNVAETGDYTVLVSGEVAEVYKIELKYLPEEFTELYNGLDEVWAVAVDAGHTAALKMDKYNPVGTGSFSMNSRANTVIGSYSHIEGYDGAATSDTTTTATPYVKTLVNQYKKGDYCHVEGYGSVAHGMAAHAEGNGTTASGNYSHAEGNSTVASGFCAHAEGCRTTASGDYSHAEGYRTTASGNYSRAEGKGTIASSINQCVTGTYNIENDMALFIVGNGASDTERSNAFAVHHLGIPWFKERPQFGGNFINQGAQTVMANGDKELILKSSTADSTKHFRITVDDAGTLTATEVVTTT